MDLIKQRRTIRKFKQDKVAKEILVECVDAGRLAPSAANLQPLEYVVVTDLLDEVFACTRWAGYLKDGAPKEGERPTAYIVILSNKQYNEFAQLDTGFAAENVILAALDKGVASCVIGALDKEKLASVLGVPKGYQIELAIALGYPAQESSAVEFEGDVKYFISDDGKLNVPKRKLNDVMHEERV